MTDTEREWIEREWWDDPFSDMFSLPNVPLVIYEIPVVQTLSGEFVSIH